MKTLAVIAVLSLAFFYLSGIGFILNYVFGVGELHNLPPFFGYAIIGAAASCICLIFAAVIVGLYVGMSNESR